MFVERTHYYARKGQAEAVLSVRQRASAIRREIGLPAGTIFLKEGNGEGPDVQWECSFASIAEHGRDLEARAASAAFRAVREEMSSLLERFERHFFRREGPEKNETALEDLSLRPEEHRFFSGSEELFGYLYMPPGRRPVPAVVLNHGSGVTRDSTDVSKPSVASVLLSWGIACFFPHRWGYGRSPGRYWREEVTSEFGTDAYDRELVRRLHRESNDVVAALGYLETLDGIDPGRVGVMGSSFGGVVSLLAAAKCDRFRCGVDFAGAAMNWEKTPRLRELMKQAARAATVPLCLIQAENDYSTRPTVELARVLARENKPFRARVFPPFGVTRDEGHFFERGGVLVWGREVRSFLEKYL
jgi:dienelactone hydrolase